MSDGTRAEVRDGRVSLAGDATAQPIVRAAETEGGWVFLAADGLVAVSEGFTGPLRALGSTAPPARRSFGVRASSGRAAIVADGALWTSDGRSLAAVDVLGRRVVEASFLDASFGAAVLADGALAFTSDGGARWALVPLDGDVALDVRTEGGLHVDLLHGGATLRRDGTLAPTTPASAPSPEDALAVARAIAERQRALGRSAFTAGEGDEGAWVSNAEDGLWVESAVGTRWLPTPGQQPLARWGEVFAFGDRVWSRLGPDGRLTIVFGPGGGRSFGDRRPGVVWSDDGRHAGWTGPCPIPSPLPEGRARDDTGGDPAESIEGGDRSDEPDGATEAAPICLLEDGVRRWRKVDLPDAQGPGVRLTLVDLHGAQGLLQNELDPDEHVTFDLDAMRRGEVRPADPSVHVTRLRWSPDGSLCGVGERCGDGCEAVVLHGRPDAMEAQPAPGRLAQVAFADARRGAALSEDGATLWRTLDAGRTWERVNDHMPEDAARHQRLVCRAHGCDLGAVAHLRGWGPLRDAPAPPLAAPPRPPRPAQTPPRDEPSVPDVAPLHCEVVGPPRRSPWASREAGPRQAWPGGVGTVTPAGSQVRVAWWEDRARGAATYPVRAEDPSAPGADVLVLGASLVFTRAESPRVFWLDGHEAREVIRTPFRAGPGTLWDRPEQLQVVRDAAGLALQATDPNANAWTVAYELGVDGRPRGRRALLLPRGASTAIARRQGRWGLVVNSANATRFEALAGGEPTPLPSWRGPMAPCAGPTAADATTLHALACTQGQPCVLLNDLGYVVGQRVVLELTAGGACVRSVHASLRGTQLDEPGGGEVRSCALHFDATGGALAGFIDDGARRRDVRCAPAERHATPDPPQERAADENPR